MYCMPIDDFSAVFTGSTSRTGVGQEHLPSTTGPGKGAGVPGSSGTHTGRRTTTGAVYGSVAVYILLIAVTVLAFVVPMYMRQPRSLYPPPPGASYAWYPSPMYHIVGGCFGILSLACAWCVAYAFRSTRAGDGRPPFATVSVMYALTLVAYATWANRHTTGAIDHGGVSHGSVGYTGNVSDTCRGRSDTSYLLLAAVAGVVSIFLLLRSHKCSHWATIALVPILVVTIKEYQLNEYHTTCDYMTTTVPIPADPT